MNYADQLKSPLWQKKRLEILERDKFTCQICLDTETQLHIHHQSYDNTYQTKAWEYPNHVYKTLCSDCHKAITDHLQEYGNDKEFNVLKVKNNGIKSLFIYTNGRLIISSSEGNTVRIGESTCIDAVQFLINNWLKNG
jgi:hypothetical protein